MDILTLAISTNKNPPKSASEATFYENQPNKKNRHFLINECKVGYQRQFPHTTNINARANDHGTITVMTNS
jgi:hypothetical protein